MEFTDLFFNERAQIVRISINIEGETKERQEKLSKKTKGKNSHLEKKGKIEIKNFTSVATHQPLDFDEIS